MVDSNTQEIKERIDQNNNSMIDAKEIENFIFDDKEGNKNLNDLGNYLNSLPLRQSNNDIIKRALTGYFMSNEWTQKSNSIKEKVESNRPLENNDIILLYLKMICFSTTELKNQSSFNPREPIDQVCGGKLLTFIKNEYKNQGYNPQMIKSITPPQNTKKYNTETSSDKKILNISTGLRKFTDNEEHESHPTNFSIDTKYLKIPQIPQLDENNLDYIYNYCGRLIAWAEQNFADDVANIRNNARATHYDQAKNDLPEYARYDILLLAYEKYCESISKNNENIIKQAGYKNYEEFSSEMEILQKFWEQTSKKYPNLDVAFLALEDFGKEMENNKKQYFKNDEELENAGKNFEEFNQFIEIKTQEYNINDIKNSFEKDPETSEEAEKYCESINKLIQCQDEISKKSESYGDSIEKYQKYLQGNQEIFKHYPGIDIYLEIQQQFAKDMQNLNNKIDPEKYEKYNQLRENSGIDKDFHNMKILGKIIMNPQDEHFPILGVKNVAAEKQKKIDERRNKIENKSPNTYRLLTSISNIWNGIVPNAMKIGSGIAYTIASLGGKDTNELNKAKQFYDNLLASQKSSKQKEEIYFIDEKGPHINLNRHNGVATVSESLGQMILILYGGHALGTGIGEFTGLGAKIARRVGLFSLSFMKGIGGSFQEAKNRNLSGGAALSYSILSATVQSGLELLSPNDIVVGQGNGLAKELIKNIINEGGKDGLIMLGKVFFKNVFKEIVNENIQEALQLTAGNLINMYAEKRRGVDFGSDWSRQNFAQTAIITTLTTGITTGVSYAIQMGNLNQQDKFQLFNNVLNDGESYTSIMEILDSAIAGEIAIPNTDISSLQQLKIDFTNGHLTTLTNTDISITNTEQNIHNTTGVENTQDNSTNQNPKNNYFDGKPHKLDVDESQALQNSMEMDNILSTINAQNRSKILTQLREKINKQYQSATHTQQNINLTNEQLLSVIEAHSQEGTIGKLTRAQLKQKVDILSRTISDQNIRRFLLEAGFCGTDGLQSNKTTINNQEYTRDKSITEMNLTNIQQIGNGAFWHCTNLTEISLSENLNTIGRYSFSATGIKEVNFSKGIKEIGASAFEDCSNLEFVSFKNATNLQTIHERTFMYCTKLKMVDIPKNISIIEQQAFANCTSLEDITISNPRCKLGHDVVKGCTSLKTITIPEIYKGREEYLGIPLACKVNYIQTDPKLKKLLYDNNGKIKEDVLKAMDKLTELGISEYDLVNILEKTNKYNALVTFISTVKEKMESEGITRNGIYFIPNPERTHGSGNYHREEQNGGNTTVTSLLNFCLMNNGEYLHVFQDMDIRQLICMSRTNIDRQYFNNGKYIEFLIKNMPIPDATTNIYHILKSYKGESAQLLNTPNNPNSNEIQQFLSEHKLAEPMKVRRFAGYYSLGHLVFEDGTTLQEVMEHQEKNKDKIGNASTEFTGKSFINEFFSSTSVNPQPQVEGSVQWDITLEEGVEAYPLDLIGGTSEAEILINRNLKRTIEGIEINGNEVTIKAKVSNPNNNTIAEKNNITSKKNSDYFNGKSRKNFKGDTTDAESNSRFSDRILIEINEQNKSEKLEELRQEIRRQYQATGKDINLTDEQLLSILEAHKQDGTLGKLSTPQLTNKRRILKETISDNNIIRFLLEAGFCGRPEEIHKTINIGNQHCEITYIGNYGKMEITNSNGTITNIGFWINSRESKYLEFSIEYGGKIENYTPIEQLCKISEEMGAGGKIGLGGLFRKLDNVVEKQILEKLINSENFSENAISYDKHNKRHTFKVFEHFLSFNVNLPQKLFTKNLLTQLINSNTFFEARAKVNYQGIELNKIYFHEMIGKYIDGIDLNSCNPELLSDLIIDYHFNKISYNVFLDIKELLRFQIEKGNFLSKEKLKIYKDILNIDKLSNEEKIELHKSLMGKNVAEMFENDIQKAREISKIETADSILNHETIKQYKDEELSKKYGINVYNFNGQPFYALAKVGRVDRINPEYAVTRSFSLVGTECIGAWGEPGNDTFLYEGLTPQQIIHISNDDSGSGSGMHDEYGQKTDYVFRLGSPSELLSNTRGYNELIILEKGTQDTVENHQLNNIKPIAIYCYEITEDIIKTAKEYGVGIALINTQKYGGKNTPNKGHDKIFEQYMYPGNFHKSEDYYYAKDGRRNELCTFENMEEIENMIE